MSMIDLSHPLVDGMPVYPGDPAATIRDALSVQRDGVAVARLDLGSHTGTHIDAPSHVIAGGRTVDLIPLELLLGPATILRVTAAAPAQRVTAAALAAPIPDHLPQIVCIATGWDRHFGHAQMTEHPYLAREFAELLWERGARVLGVDTLSPDPSDGATPAPGEGLLPVHEFWLGNDGVIVENLRGLDRLTGAVELSLFPLAIQGGDGAPIRAVARQLDS